MKYSSCFQPFQYRRPQCFWETPLAANSSLFQSWSPRPAGRSQARTWFLTDDCSWLGRDSKSGVNLMSTLIVIAWSLPCPDVNFNTFWIGNYTASTQHYKAPGASRCCLCKSATVGTAQAWPKSSSWFTHLLCSLGLPGSCCCSHCS